MRVIEREWYLLGPYHEGREAEEAETLRSGCERSIARVCWLVLVSAVLFMRLSLWVYSSLQVQRVLHVPSYEPAPKKVRTLSG